LKAVVYDGYLSCRDVPPPTPEGNVVLSVRRAGICGTDLAIASGDYKVKTPLILGHEVFGTARRVPGGMEGLLEKRCVTEINIGCGRCEFCRAGVRSHCKRGEALGIHRSGGFAEYLAVPLENVHQVPESISDDEAVFVEPLAACVQITKMAGIEPGSSCVVVGTGRMGLLIVQLLKLLRPGTLAAIGHSKSKLVMAKTFGAHAFDASEVDSALALTGGSKFDNVIEATGNPEGATLALGLVKPRGTLHVKSTPGVPVQIDMTKVVVDEIRIQGSRCGPFEEAIELLRSHKVRVQDMITDRFPLERCVEAFERAGSKSSIKVIFDI